MAPSKIGAEMYRQSTRAFVIALVKGARESNARLDAADPTSPLHLAGPAARTTPAAGLDGLA